MGRSRKAHGEEAGGGNAAVQGEREAEESGERDEGEVEHAAVFDVPGVVGGVGDADPEEVDAAARCRRSSGRGRLR